MFRIAKVTERDPQKGYIKVEFFDDNTVSDWMSILPLSANQTSIFVMPNINDQVVVGTIDKYWEDCICFGAVYSNPNPPKKAGDKISSVVFEDGSSVFFDASSGNLEIEAKGNIIIKSNSTVTIECVTANIKSSSTLEVDANIVNIGGNVNINGQLVAAGDVKAANGAVGLLTHIHTAPPSGGPTTPAVG